jgi:alpha-beta hydrolase superfamily lysophospholipase
MADQEQMVVSPRGEQIFVHEWIPQTVKGTVVLVHGLGEHVGRYEHVARAFNEANYALLGFDLPGHGRTGGVRGHIPSTGVVMDLISSRLADASLRFPEVPHFLYGHSLGGNHVLYHGLTCRPAVAGIISTSPGLGLAKAAPAWQLALVKLLVRLAPSMTINNGLDRSGLSHDPAVIQAYQDDPLVHPKISTRLALDLVSNGEWIIAHAGEFPSIPLLLMQGSLDRLVSPQATDAFAKGCSAQLTYKVWEGLYHELHNEFEKDETIQFMVDWMDLQVSKK